MLDITFYDVGQGDAIQITWKENGINKIGIIDCNKFPSNNKIITYLQRNSITQIEFIILSHFHVDHFSGLNDVFRFCTENNIKINLFLHTFASQVLEIYDKMHFISKKVETEIGLFMELIEVLNIGEEAIVDCFTKSIKLIDDINLSFYSPDAATYRDIAKKISRKKNKVVCSNADINRLATIIRISNSISSVLLTSDAVKKSFYKIRDKVEGNYILSQAPHHGSYKNIDEHFWKNLSRESNCPIVFSVGDEPKDKLPDFRTVDFFINNNYDIYSTNCVYGISEINSNINTESQSNTINLDLFSNKINTINTKPQNEDNFIGDKYFTVFKNKT